MLHPGIRWLAQGGRAARGLPPTRRGTWPNAEVDWLVGWMGVENVGYPGAGDDDAGVTVTGGQHAQAASLQVEGGGVLRPDSGCRTMVTSNSAPCRRLAVSTLIIRGGGRSSACQGLADLVGLIAVRDADGESLRPAAGRRVPFAGADSPAGEQPDRQRAPRRRLPRCRCGSCAGRAVRAVPSRIVRPCRGWRRRCCVSRLL